MKYALLLAVGCVALSGCRTSVNTTEGYDKAGRMNIVEDARVDTDPSMAGRVGVTLINDRIAPNGFKQVQIRFTNFRNSRQLVSYQVEWFDLDGMMVSTATGGWRDLPIEARENRFEVFTAPNAQAHDFIIKLINK